MCRRWSFMAMMTRSFRSRIPPMLSSKLIKNATLKIYPGAPHGLFATHKNQLNEDLLAFIRK